MAGLPDLAQADDAQGMAVRVVSYSGDVLVCVLEGWDGERARAEEGPDDGAEGGEDEYDGTVGYRLGACWG